MTTAEIRNLVKENGWNLEYETIAIRTQEQSFELGAIDHQSSVWDNGTETGDLLDGISATTIKSDAGMAQHHNGYYFGSHTAILGCQRSEMGEDIGEVIMEDAVVLYIIK
jgi:hypothetical protein